MALAQIFAAKTSFMLGTLSEMQKIQTQITYILEKRIDYR